MTNTEVYVYSKVVAKTVRNEKYSKARTMRRLIRYMYHMEMITEGQFDYLVGVYLKNAYDETGCNCIGNYYCPSCLEGRIYK